MRANTRLRAASNIAKHEGRELSMYRDSKGVVTVGVGHALFTLVEACRLNFHSGNREATASEIVTDYYRVQKTGKRGSLMLPFEDVDRLLAFDIAKYEHITEKTFPELESYPEGAQVALLDICFNCGSFTDWVELPKAVRAGDWQKAATESKRKPPVGDERNRNTAAQFTEHLQEEKAA